MYFNENENKNKKRLIYNSHELSMNNSYLEINKKHDLEFFI